MNDEDAWKWLTLYCTPHGKLLRIRTIQKRCGSAAKTAKCAHSLKGWEELKKSHKADNVPRSRSDVDMDAAAEVTRLHQSASSSASSLSTRSLDNPTPPYTPKLSRRSMESPNMIFTDESLLANLQEDDLGHMSDPEPDAQNWQHTVGREVAQHLSAKERARQEVIHELFMTEASHLRVLRVLDHIFYQRMRKENLLSTEERLLMFPNLPELIEIHNYLVELIKRVREEGPVVKEIGDLMLSRFDGAAGQEVSQETAKFCSCQTIALDLIKIKKRKEARFNLFMQEAESSPQCRRLQLKDLIVSEMQRLTKYPLLLENIIKNTRMESLQPALTPLLPPHQHRSYRPHQHRSCRLTNTGAAASPTSELPPHQHRSYRLTNTGATASPTPELLQPSTYCLLPHNPVESGTPEYEKLCHSWSRCKDILKFVNEAVKQRDNEYRLGEYQKRLDSTSLERSNNPVAAEFKNLDLTTRRMIHEGSLTWKITKDKTIDLHVLLLEDLLVLLQKKDEKLVLKCRSKTSVVSSDTKQTFSPVIKLNSVLVRSVATDKRAFFIICPSEHGPEIYELVALTSSEKNTWKDLLEEAAKSATRHPPTFIKLSTQSVVHSGTPSKSSVLQDAIPNLLSEASMRTNSEDLTIDENQGEFLGHSHKSELLLEESESLEEDEAQTPTQLPFPSQVEDTGVGLEDRSYPTYLAYQWPSVSEGLAKSALEDVQNLRQLILRRLLPMRHSDHSEDDHTPTPSVSDGAGYPCEMVTESVTDTLDDGLGEVSSQCSSIAESSGTTEDFAYRHKRQGSKDAEDTMWDMVDSHLKGSSELENQND
ncbi:unnamed protein product [Ranitomeya imitator]|uniref:Rho guanine nucleotide exchange factor 11 n=1 Tax=Ranitomeya imitator TaxID=111125 RepID=A0ABN9LYW8_9NEOB|nr:unnamed protein product [Ranitomeya imitator]